MNQLDAISQAIGALQAQGQERSAQMERLDTTLNTKIDTLIREVRDGYHKKANEIQENIGQTERLRREDMAQIATRIHALETFKDETVGTARANTTWVALIAAAVSAAVSTVAENWHAIFGARP